MHKIFISSTFKDMQAERDMLHTYVYPQLKRIAREYGENVEFVDLRWGINTNHLDEKEGMNKILEVCLDEIDNCKPYFIAFIGDRYGTIPKPDLMKYVSDKKNLKLKSDLSVTALEIEYGLLSNRNSEINCMICFRELLNKQSIDNDTKEIFLLEENVEKLNSLKDRLQKEYSSSIIHYKATWDDNSQKMIGLEDLADQIIEYFKDTLIAKWEHQKQRTWQEKERYYAKAFVDEVAGKFNGYDNELKELCKAAVASNILILRGSEGSGKTSMLCELSKTMESKYEVLNIICGNSERSIDIIDIIEQMVHWLEDMTGNAHADIAFNIEYDNSKNKGTSIRDRREYLSTLLSKLPQNKTYVVMIDSPELIKPKAAFRSLAFLPFSIVGNCHFVMSCPSDFDLPDMYEYSGKTIEKSLDEIVYRYSVAEIVAKGISKAHGKDIDDIIIKKIKDKNSSNPLYISLLMQRLLMMNSAELSEVKNISEFTKKVSKIIEECPQDILKLSVDILENAADKIGSQDIMLFAKLLSVSEHGLRIEDYMQICAMNDRSCNTVDIYRLLNYLSEFFTVDSSGAYYFSHASIKKGIAESCEDIEELHRLWLNYIRKYEKDDYYLLGKGMLHAYYLKDQEYVTGHFCYTKAYDNLTTNNILDGIYDVIMLDSAVWFKSVISSDKVITENNFFLSYLIVMLPNLFSKTDKDDTAYKEVMKTLLISCKRIITEGKAVERRNYYDVIDAYKIMAEFSYIRGEYQKARSYVEEAKPYAEITFSQYSSLESGHILADFYITAAQTYEGLYIFPEAKEYYTKCIHIREKILKERKDAYSKTQYAEGLKELAHLCAADNEFEKAEELLIKAISLLDKNNENVAVEALMIDICCYATTIFSLQGKKEKAQEFADHGLNTAICLHRELNSMASLGRLQQAYRIKGQAEFINERYEEAEHYYTLALEKSQEIISKFNNKKALITLGESYIELGDYYARRGKFKKAIDSFLYVLHLKYDVGDADYLLNRMNLMLITSVLKSDDEMFEKNIFLYKKLITHMDAKVVEIFNNVSDYRLLYDICENIDLFYLEYMTDKEEILKYSYMIIKLIQSCKDRKLIEDKYKDILQRYIYVIDASVKKSQPEQAMQYMREMMSLYQYAPNAELNLASELSLQARMEEYLKKLTANFLETHFDRELCINKNVSDILEIYMLMIDHTKWLAEKFQEDDIVDFHLGYWHNAVCMLYGSLLEHDKAVVEGEKAVEIWRKYYQTHSGTDKQQLFLLYAVMASNYMAIGDEKMALRSAKRAMRGDLPVQLRENVIEILELAGIEG